jgi:putative inorganic carbon (hco3(-)) transporter
MRTLSWPRRLLKENVVLLVVAMLVVIPLLAPFTQSISGRALRNSLFQSIGILLVFVLFARVDIRGGLPRLWYLARCGVNIPLALFLLWAAVGVLRSPHSAFATAELLRLGMGALVYFVVALHLETRAQLCLLIDCLLGVVILVVGTGLLFQVNQDPSGIGLSSTLPSRHHLSGILAVLFPLLAGLSLGGTHRGRRIAAITAAILCGVGLLLCLERSAWIATCVSLLIWLCLAGPSMIDLRRARRAGAVFAITAIIVVGAVGFVAAAGVDALVAGRAHEVSTALEGRDFSFAWRVQKWRGTVAMVARRPVWGWGPGQFVLEQYPYTHLGLPADEVRRYGASFDEMAYNEYLQTAAELGLPGLALYLLILASFFSKAGRALRRLPDGLRRIILLGCIAGAAAQMVDAMANGSWRYAECSVFFWLILGLGMAVTRMAYHVPPPIDLSAAEPVPAGQAI